MYATPNGKVQADDNGDFDLDALLAESIQQSHDNKALTKGKTKLRSGWVNSTERAQLLDDVEKAEKRREWYPSAAVAIFRQQTCACGAIHTHFQGLFIEQTHRNAYATRWVKAVDSISMAELPRKRKVDIETTDMCVSCAESLRW